MSAIAGRFHGQFIADGDTGAGTACGTGSRRSPVWDRCRDSAITWLSPVSDVDAVVEVCNLVDDVPQARRWYRENGSTRDPHALIVAQKMLQSALSGIGFDPAGRSKLGVAGTARHGPGGPAVAPGAVSRRTTVAVATAGADTDTRAGRSAGGVQRRRRRSG
jgi:hypothetical protein